MRFDSSMTCWLIRDTKSLDSIVIKTKGGYYKLFQYNFKNFLVSKLCKYQDFLLFIYSKNIY